MKKLKLLPLLFLILLSGQVQAETWEAFDEKAGHILKISP
jgi:hypothetical protein